MFISNRCSSLTDIICHRNLIKTFDCQLYTHVVQLSSQSDVIWIQTTTVLTVRMMYYFYSSSSSTTTSGGGVLVKHVSHTQSQRAVRHPDMLMDVRHH